MKLLSNIRAKRSTAVAVLLVWLFALASGVVNACLLEAPEAHFPATTSGTSQATHAPAELARHTGPDAGHGDDSDTYRASCLRACVDGSQSLVKQYCAIDQTDPGTAFVVAVLWTASARVVAERGRIYDLQPPAPGPPLRVRYSRLAL